MPEPVLSGGKCLDPGYPGLQKRTINWRHSTPRFIQSVVQDSLRLDSSTGSSVNFQLSRFDLVLVTFLIIPVVAANAAFCANFLARRPDWTTKLGCVVRMVVDSILPHAGSGSNDHRKDVPQFSNHLMILLINKYETGWVFTSISTVDTLIFDA